MSIASMLIPATVKAELSPEYPESDCQQQASQQSSQEGQSQQCNQDCDMPTDCSAFRPKSPRKSASEGFSTPPVNISSSGLPSAFKSPQSLQSSVSPGNAADDLSCRGYNGSPDTPEVESVRFTLLIIDFQYLIFFIPIVKNFCVMSLVFEISVDLL